MKSSKEVKSQLTYERQHKIEKRSKALIQGEYALRSLRQQRNVTQINLSELMGMDQNAISRLESRQDFLLSTLNAYVQALGGKLEIYARFPDEAMPIELSAILSDSSYQEEPQ